jgi:hypothetical protein
MKPQKNGTILLESWVTVDPKKLAHLATAIGTPSAEETALLVPFFGPTAAGEQSVIDALGLDLSKALQGSQSYEWHREFRPGERVRLTVELEDLVHRGEMEFAVVRAEFRDLAGTLVQRQRTLFVERERNA